MQHRFPLLLGLAAALVLFLALWMAGVALISAVLSGAAIGFAAFIVWLSVKRVWARNFGSGRDFGRSIPPT